MGASHRQCACSAALRALRRCQCGRGRAYNGFDALDVAQGGDSVGVVREGEGRPDEEGKDEATLKDEYDRSPNTPNF